MITTIKNKIVLTAILFITVFSISAYAVDKKYIPNTANAAISFSLDNLSKKAEGDLQQIFNSLFMQKFADNYLGYRDDEAVAEIMTNKLAQLFDFSKASKIIFLNDYKQSSIIIDILDISELDKLMIKMASQEDKLISFSENEKYRYLSLDENILISWNNEVFVLSLRGLIFEDDLNIKTSADIIFNSDSLENEYFISLENDTNDFYAWADLSILSDSESSLFELFGNMPEDIKDIYKGGILTAKVNFNDGIADMIFDTYLPNNDYDILSTKKELPEKELLENLYKFVNGDKNYGFLSFRFNSSSTIVKSFISSFVNNEISSQLLELCDGDIFVSAWDTEEENTDLETKLETVKAALAAIGNAEKAAEEIGKLPSADNAKLSDKSALDQVKKLLDGLTENEKAMLGKDAPGKVDALAEKIKKLAEEANSPKTGDTSNLALWIALLFISGGIVTGTTVASKKKKRSVK